ncbi:MAG TPA: TonB-dependent receptor plug domain-containing protein, partial [Gemmatimonadaceae bacterium]
MQPPSVALALILSIGAGAGLPQQPGGPGPRRPAAADSTIVSSVRDSVVRQLDEIVVTAAGMPTPIGDAAYAAARNGPDVTRRARAGLGLSEPLHAIPGVQVDNRYNHALGERITVRGFGARTQFGVRGVRVIVDGIPATMPDGQTTLNHLDLGTIESVEVIRTPMAALFGNASGGVIAVRTAPPPDAPLAISSRLVTGSDGLMRRQGGVGGTTAAGSYLLHAGRLDYDGYRAHNSAENRYFAAGTQSNLGPASFALTFHHVSYDALNPGALPDSLLRRDRTAAFPLNVAQKTGESGRHSQAGASVERPVASYVLATSVYFVRRKLDNPIPPRIIQLSRRAGGARVSLGTAKAESARLAWDAGLETAVQQDDRLNYANVSGAPGELTLDQAER